ncbi:MAG: 50S ribosomal protein L1 [Candidatus Andersenbacteria bacterium RIFCSPHIGHO2_12_FULL_46_9]|nr:MAG: 50S ribosomal protein L1 [Candidatus Andersenbacteria bacterium RIFCSPHIGHO2_02_FULL_46_16]OGY38015.1 MAG: 50S ribosomal protein L1 [Candidatus Andersenbacteria bacterium RIFCSPLOWO2_02_FULL_46_11]OGY38503.1 MAG: 50S ribosomal protein L1 [Candidatus Andersenbacteria bacterium RIFCSPHIGHO2_12_FULL_46_9]OGY42193.1 MAG: 50S ribosomal protein L1 [Candidatus Andersenbacteria bacterium RIFCSPLOWO2_12_FULL_45_8]
MAMRSKPYQQMKKSAPAQPVTIEEAMTWLKENTKTKFDSTVEVHLRLGVDPQKSDQMVRGQIVLPAGAVTKPAIVVFTDNAAQQKEALAAGAAAAGGIELINQIKTEGSLRADITISTPSMMPKVAQIAKVLGPQGLMPNPKTGTVTDQPAVVIGELLAGKISFKMDQLGNIHQAVGKISWDADKIILNTKVFLEAVKAAKPSASRGEFFKSIFLKSTMSPSIPLKV